MKSLHFGVITSGAPSHLTGCLSLAKELQRRGHRITFYQFADNEERVRSAGFNYREVGAHYFPRGKLKQIYTELGKQTGLKALRFTLNLIRKRTEALFADLPQLIAIDPVDALIVDQVCIEGGTLAEQLKIPFITVSIALIFNQESGVPPLYTTWLPTRGPLGSIKNKIAYGVLNSMTRSTLQIINAYREQVGLSPVRHADQLISPLLHLSQQPPGFEFPRKKASSSLKFVGPFIEPSVRKNIPFPFEKLDARPLVYASMGTLQNQQQEIFACIAEACADLPIQLVISLGGGGRVEDFSALPGSPLVVEFAPQLELLQRAQICITHAGLNTALECLAAGVPMVAIPITNDQPGVAARVQWTGTGRCLPLKKLSAQSLREELSRVLNDLQLKTNAQKFQRQIEASSGTRQACDFIELGLSNS